MLKEISRIKGTQLYDRLVELRASIMQNAHEQVASLLQSSENAHGEFYTYFFDRDNQDGQDKSE